MDQLGEAEANFLREKLKPFLERNPEADVKVAGVEPTVIRPWGEEAIEIPLHSSDSDLIEALNTIRLPPRFTAIWHEDTKEFEVIFTVLTGNNPLLKREFEYRYKENCLQCSYEPSSPRLRTIARTARPSGKIWRSDFRNLHPFYSFEHLSEEDPELGYVKSGQPTSFWIRGIEQYDDDRIGEIVRNLNFSMSYFDRHSPLILVHEEPVKPHEVDDLHPPQIGSFPAILSGQEIDQHLLILWESARRGDPFLRFIHYYQILEYAGFYHLRYQIKREIERAVAAPDALARPDRVAQQILDAVSAEKRQDEPKINEMIDECVDLEEMWKILDGSLAAFSEEVKLDGGFTLPALVSPSIGYEEFAKIWNKQFSPALHRVRNALVHARESRQSTTIAPTIANYSRLSPWLLPLSQTAARVMLYSRL